MPWHSANAHRVCLIRVAISVNRHPNPPDQLSLRRRRCPAAPHALPPCRPPAVLLHAPAPAPAAPLHRRHPHRPSRPPATRPRQAATAAPAAAVRLWLRAQLLAPRRAPALPQSQIAMEPQGSAQRRWCWSCRPCRRRRGLDQDCCPARRGSGLAAAVRTQSVLCTCPCHHLTGRQRRYRLQPVVVAWARAAQRCRRCRRLSRCRRRQPCSRRQSARVPPPRTCAAVHPLTWAWGPARRAAAHRQWLLLLLLLLLRLELQGPQRRCRELSLAAIPVHRLLLHPETPVRPVLPCPQCHRLLRWY